MVVQKGLPLHLGYCLNVHRGESWPENLAAIRDHALAVRRLVAPESSFGLGLRLSHQAAQDLESAAARRDAAAYLKGENLYAFTVNGFPYGRFHETRVKESVYQPDWRTFERRDYTNLLADILADLLPEGGTGSISTSPCSFKPWVGPGDAVTMAQRLAECAGHLHAVSERTGKEIHLGLEPEPGCYLETTEETVAFFNGPLRTDGARHLASTHGWDRRRAEEAIRRHLGVCFDTCHAAIQFEDLPWALKRYEQEGIRVSKIQLSSALRIAPTEESLRALVPFCEPVYLHQVKARRRSGEILSWTDLPEALRDAPGYPDIEEMRIHFHIPLFFEGNGELLSTASLLDGAFFQKLGGGPVSHLEIETYTFDVLPPELRGGGIVQSIAREYEWVLSRLGTPGHSLEASSFSQRE